MLSGDDGVHVARRICLATFSEGSLEGPDFRLVSASFEGTDAPDVVPWSTRHACRNGADVRRLGTSLCRGIKLAQRLDFMRPVEVRPGR